jgi:hypothetical protein
MIQLVVKFLPLAMSAGDAADYIGNGKLFADMRSADWIRPCPNATHKMALFDRGELETCYARYRAGEYPNGQQSENNL